MKTIKTLLAHKNLWLTIALLWTFIIFYLCLIDSSKLPSLELKIDWFDKFVHFSFHFIFTVFWLLYINASIINVEKYQIAKVILTSFLIGVIIETIQAFFTTTRNADFLDVIANSLGAISSGILMYKLLNRINKLKAK